MDETSAWSPAGRLALLFITYGDAVGVETWGLLIRINKGIDVVQPAKFLIWDTAIFWVQIV
jgi:hypothetical protein